MHPLIFVVPLISANCEACSKGALGKVLSKCPLASERPREMAQIANCCFKLRETLQGIGKGNLFHHLMSAYAHS